MHMSVEQALVALSETPLPETRQLAWRWPAPEWQRFFLLAGSHGVLGIVHDNLQRCQSRDPQAFGKRIPGMDLARRLWRAQAVRTLWVRKWTERMQPMIAAAGIPCAILKGIDFADHLYPQPALRATRDVDLLIPRARWEDAERIFEQARYEKLAPNYSLTKEPDCGNTSWKLDERGEVLLELHWNLIYRQSVRRQMALEFADLDWQPAGGDCQALLMATPATRLVLAAAHAISHAFDRLLLLCDLRQACRQMVRELSLEPLHELLDRTGTRKILELALAVLSRNMPDPSVSELARQIPPRLSVWAASRCISRDAVLKAKDFIPYYRRNLLRNWLKYAA